VPPAHTPNTLDEIDMMQEEAVKLASDKMK